MLSNRTFFSKNLKKSQKSRFWVNKKFVHTFFFRAKKSLRPPCLLFFFAQKKKSFSRSQTTSFFRKIEKKQKKRYFPEKSDLRSDYGTKKDDFFGKKTIFLKNEKKPTFFGRFVNPETRFSRFFHFFKKSVKIVKVRKSQKKKCQKSEKSRFFPEKWFFEKVVFPIPIGLFFPKFPKIPDFPKKQALFVYRIVKKTETSRDLKAFFDEKVTFAALNRHFWSKIDIFLDFSEKYLVQESFGTKMSYCIRNSRTCHWQIILGQTFFYKKRLRSPSLSI